MHDEDEDELENVDQGPPEDVNYDSEENEIELEDDQDLRATKAKPTISDFFEDEAELSESDWGSADEDEKDLDALDFEAGDDERFDEKQLRRDLEKIHMRRMLDDDQREVQNTYMLLHFLRLRRVLGEIIARAPPGGWRAPRYGSRTSIQVEKHRQCRG